MVTARAGGVTVRACIFDATVAAVDEEVRAWPSAEARRTAENACRAVDPPTVTARPVPAPKPPAAARLLWSLANRIAARQNPR
ncbi:hypothetical protein ACIQ9J_21945 [Streptomyces sp. NPDC094153]|uniref:hypothetical protein n=1 Tax=Streptomyces sp. NPDC094153 TaxID=3366058 RepID=UPI003801E703